MTVHRLLVTAYPDVRAAVWAATALSANWLECRDHPARDGAQTCLVTVFAEQLPDFLDLARQVNDTAGPVTVEEIHGAGDDETYTLLLGEPGTGWPDTTLLATISEHHAQAARKDPATIVGRLADELDLPDH